MRQIAQNLKGKYKEIVLGPLFKLLEAIMELFVPLVMASIIDNGIIKGDKETILRGGLLLVLLAVLCVAAGMICQYYAAVAAGHFGKGLRGQVYKHVLSLSQNETDLYGAGGLITRLTNDVNQMQNGVNMTIRLATRAPFLAVGSIVMAMVVSWKVGLIFLLATPVIGLVLYVVMKRTLPSYTKIQKGQDSLSRLSGENLEGARVIRAFSRQEKEQQDYETQAMDLSALMMRVGKVSAVLNPLTGFIVNLAIIAIVWAGAGFAFKGELLPGEIIALVSYMNQTLLAMLVGANLVILFTRALASTKRVAEVLETKPSIVDGKGAKENPAAPAIAFENVAFAYHAEAETAVEGLNFAINKGQIVGIIGGTGSGKTTLVNLLLRYYDVTTGSVQVCGANVKDYTLHGLRQKIGLVPQTAALFSGSIRRNLQIGAKEATDEEMWEALQLAQAADFVENIPEKLDGNLVEGGKNLSGGQRQRLTIARALVRKPEILVLDDSSSALDYATDAALQKGLRAQAQKRGLTVVMISQRVAALQKADFILVLDDGNLAGKGTHEELLRENEVYQEICASQGVLPKQQA